MGRHRCQATGWWGQDPSAKEGRRKASHWSHLCKKRLLIYWLHPCFSLYCKISQTPAPRDRHGSLPVDVINFSFMLVSLKSDATRVLKILSIDSWNLRVRSGSWTPEEGSSLFYLLTFKTKWFHCVVKFGELSLTPPPTKVHGAPSPKSTVDADDINSKCRPDSWNPSGWILKLCN